MRAAPRGADAQGRHDMLLSFVMLLVPVACTLRGVRLLRWRLRRAPHVHCHVLRSPGAVLCDGGALALLCRVGHRRGELLLQQRHLPL